MFTNGYRPRLIVFDLDGTLIDSRRDLADSANALLASHGRPHLDDEVVVAMVGEGARTLVSRVMQAGGATGDVDEALDRFLDIYNRRLLDHTRPYPGVAEGLPRLAGVAALAVLTNKPQAHTDRLLAHFGWDRLLCGAIGGDTAHGRKPDPAGLRSLTRAAGVTPDETLLVGDSWVDVDTARRAGARVCFADYGFGHIPPGGLLETERRVASFPELVSHLLPGAGLA
jgi:phosphoglycolate phosphatase